MSGELNPERVILEGMSKQFLKELDKDRKKQRRRGSGTILVALFGVAISGYFAFFFQTAAEGSDVVNIGLLSQAERGTTFGIGLCLLGVIEAIRGK
jgi:hypothetical protein